MTKQFITLVIMFFISPWAGAEGTHAKQTETTQKVEVDNSGVNKRDISKNGEARTLTPDDQTQGSKQDVEITRKIRADLMKEKDLSLYAQNVKIITLNGVVHLRGPVMTMAEKQKVAATAQKYAGAAAVTNDIEVKNK